MKTKSPYIALAVSCFLAGFLVCCFLMLPLQPTPAPAETVAVPTLPPVAMLTLPTISTQTVHMGGGNWHAWPEDGEQLQTPPAMPQSMSSETMRRMHPGYYDLIDTRSRYDADLKTPK